jgi:cell division protein FtsI (penicillin-binding protein 3)
VFGILTARVVQLQVLSGDRYQKLTAAQTMHTIPISAERGSIFDRNGRDLALSVERSTVYADPTLVNDPAGEAAKLAPVLHADTQYLVKQLSARPYRFAYLAHTVPDAVASAVTALGLPGIGLMPESARSYPAAPLAGALLGRVGSEGKGTDGLEYLYDSLLHGKAGELTVEQDPQGHDIPNTQKTRVEAERGSDIVLSVDEDVQWEAEHALLDQVQATGAKSGMSAIVDVSNGDVLAITSVDGTSKTDPAHVAAPGEHNAPLTELFAPGSTTKLITLSWAIEHGHVTPQTMFTVPYSIKVDDNVDPFYDAEWHATRQWTTADILRESSNVGTIEIAQRMRNKELAAGVRAFGLGTRTSVAWPGQPAGLVLSPDKYYATGKYSTAIGYGAAVTGMQMLDAFVTIANGGVTRPPHLLDATVDANGTRHPYQGPAGVRVVSSSTAAEMTAMMRGVVADGTGVCAAIPGYPVAGKTGTSKKLQANGTYSDTSTMASFIGFAPADHPRFAAIVVLDSPAYDFQFGGASAAPVWSEMMQFVLTHYGVPPTDTNDAQYQQARQAAKQAGTPCTVPHGDALAGAIAARANAQAHTNRQAQQVQQAQSQGQHAQQGQGGSQSGTRSDGGMPSRPGAAVPTDSLPADTSPSN